MKFILLISTILLILSAQGSYTQGKIDMHGGSQDKYYNNFNSNGAFRSSSTNMSKFLDRNSTKNITVDKVKK